MPLKALPDMTASDLADGDFLLGTCRLDDGDEVLQVHQKELQSLQLFGIAVGVNVFSC